MTRSSLYRVNGAMFRKSWLVKTGAVPIFPDMDERNMGDHNVERLESARLNARLRGDGEEVKVVKYL